MTAVATRLILCSLVTALACTNKQAKYANGPSCEERQGQLVTSLQSLPEVVLEGPRHVPLAQASLAGAFGDGTLLELNEPLVVFSGTTLSGKTQSERVEQLRQAALQLTVAASAKPLYVAASANTDVRTLNAYLGAIPQAFDVKLTFARKTAPLTAGDASESSTYGDRLLLEPDPNARRRIAAEGYDAYSDCAAIDTAVEALQNEPEATRLAKLRAELLNAVPQCPCSEIDPDGLRWLVNAEQRAGNVALGTAPGNFLRDVRCRASMPLRSTQQVLDDMERFEDEFSGNWDSTGLTYEEVLSNDRLLNYLCGAMPGEIYEAVSADFAALYVRTANSAECREFRLEPVARGAVFGTLRATDNPAQSFHYRLGGNDLRLFGPVAAPDGRATDPGPWACDKDHKLSASDSDFLQVESGGRLYFTRHACERATPQQASFTTCAFDPNLIPPVAPAAPEGTETPATPAEPAATP